MDTTPLTHVGSRLHRFRLRVLRHRRPLAALAVGLAVWLGVQAAMSPPSPTVPVWTAARDLAPGTVVAASDLVESDFLEGTAPSSALADPTEVIGRPLVQAVDRGQPLAASAVLGERWLRDQGGHTVVPVRISDAEVVRLLRVGDRIDLHGTPMGSTDAAKASSVLVEAARVVAVPPVAKEGSDAALSGRLVLLSVPETSVANLTFAAARQFLSVAWSR